MTILEALIQLRDDLKKWVTNNLRVKIDINQGTKNSGEFLTVDKDGNVGIGSGRSLSLIDIENGYTYLIQMKGGELTSQCKTSSIEITSLPLTTVYVAGDKFDPTGMVVTAICEDGSTKEITNYTCSMSGNVVTVTYIEAGKVNTTTLEVLAYNSREEALVDFEYTNNGDGTYTITDWKETLNGVASTEMVIPNSSKIVL